MAASEESAALAPARAAWRRWMPPARLVKAQVVLAGAGIMVLEMLGGRLLAPRFGSTIYTWGALIGIVMAALAAGYYLGGRFGDRRPAPSTLATLLFAAGAYAIVLPLFAPFALAAISHAVTDVRAGPMLASLVLLAPPSLVLGAATPVAVRLAGGAAERAGSTAGAMAGASTVGSIVGTFGTVFVLVPLFDVASILAGTGALLCAAALLTAERRAASAVALVAILAVTPLGYGLVGPALVQLQTGITDEVLFSKSTPYHELYVTQSRGAGAERVRSLILDGNHHSSMYVERPNETSFRYPEWFHLGPLLSPNATRALFIGGGGFTGPKQFLATYPAMQVDVVELDPDVVDAARRFFAVPDDARLAIHVEDGRRFLERAEATWDVIVLDAYGRNYVPFHLMTLEFLALVREHLAPGGVVVSNLIGSLDGPASLLMRSEARTMAATLPWTRHAPIHPGLPNAAQNVLLLGALAEPPGWATATARAAEWQAERGRKYADVLGTVQEQSLRFDDVAIFRDDFAPVEALVSPLTGRPYDPEG
jgi:spermidine synthase